MSQIPLTLKIETASESDPTNREPQITSHATLHQVFCVRQHGMVRLAIVSRAKLRHLTQAILLLILLFRFTLTYTHTHNPVITQTNIHAHTVTQTHYSDSFSYSYFHTDTHAHTDTNITFLLLPTQIFILILPSKYIQIYLLIHTLECFL